MLHHGQDNASVASGGFDLEGVDAGNKYSNKHNTKLQKTPQKHSTNHFLNVSSQKARNDSIEK